MNKGVLYALGAYVFWGLHPIYWKLLEHVDSFEIVANRIVWSFLFFAIILSIRGEWKSLKEKFGNSNNKSLLFLPALLIGSNWAVYIWAVNAGYIIETSLGYFISPLLIVLLGVVILGEKLRGFQWLAIGLAFFGVLIMTFIYGRFPWISLYLAGTWALYGLLRKKSPLTAIEGLTLETGLMLIPGLGYLGYTLFNGSSMLLVEYDTTALLIGAGIISGFPLVIFIKGARLVKLSLIGILQYIYPTLIFLVGVFIYKEDFNEAKFVGFIFIWIALIIFTFGSTVSIISKKAFGFK